MVQSREFVGLSEVTDEQTLLHAIQPLPRLAEEATESPADDLGPGQLAVLKRTALQVREHVLRMSARGGCFVGSALSAVDLLVYLYGEFLYQNRDNLHDPERDYLFLSKGHAVPALYGTLCEIGLLEEARLESHLRINDSIYWHPNCEIPGVEFHAGSLGHLLSVAAGVALDCRICQQDNRVVVIVGDGELDEGSNWEACLFAAAYGLDNLTIVVDRNGFQANARTEELIPLEPLGRKFEAFGCRPARVNGHDFGALHQAFSQLPFSVAQPSVIIAETIRGYGVPTIEELADRWFILSEPEEAELLIEELHATLGQVWSIL
jgi:transketolase